MITTATTTFILCCWVLLLELLPSSSFLFVNSRALHAESVSKRHLIVITHGLMGSSKDLTWLADSLTKRGHNVLLSNTNEFTKSLRGIEVCSEALLDEISHYVKMHSTENLSLISFVGNSLGGIFNRHAIKLMVENDCFRRWRLAPHSFMTIATPHLGVYHHNIFEDTYLANSHMLKTFASSLFFASGRDLFASEEASLLFKMGTESQWLDALLLFKKRRLYANLFRDSVVPVSTAAILSHAEGTQLRNRFKGKFGIVTIFNSTASTTSAESACRGGIGISAKIVPALDQIGWEKVIVNFAGVYPLAHNKLCAMTRWPSWLFEDLLGFKEGVFVMQNASDWLHQEF